MVLVWGGATETVLDRQKSESLLTLGGIEVVSRDVDISVGSPRRQFVVEGEALAAVLLS